MSAPGAKPFNVLSIFWMIIGAFLAAVSVDVILQPNALIDGGVTGISMILSHLFGRPFLPYFVFCFNIPFIYLAYRNLGKKFVIQMIIGIILFAIFLQLLEEFPKFHGDPLEVVVFGGITLGLGIGLIIRMGGCSDGSEILAIIASRSKGFTIGQVVLFINAFIFAAAGYVYGDWNTALRSFITYMVTYKTMDFVIVGLDEIKSVMIISQKPKEIADTIIHQLGLGLTIMYGRGGFTGSEREILLVVVERLQIAELKDLVLSKDPTAFMAIENLHEVVYGRGAVLRKPHFRKKKKTKTVQ